MRCKCGETMTPRYAKNHQDIAGYLCMTCGADANMGPTRSIRGSRSPAQPAQGYIPGLGRMPRQKAQKQPQETGSHLEQTLEAQLKGLHCGGFLREYVFAEPRRWRFDFAWPHLHLAVEIEGGTWSYKQSRHTSMRGYAADCAKYNHAAIAGWCVLRYTSKEVGSGKAAEEIKQAVLQKQKEHGRK